MEDSRMKRRETTIDIYLSSVGTRTIDVECSLPDLGWGEEPWYLPVAFFPKENVAPNLEVTRADGEITPVPTKLQNNAITQLAIKQLFESGRLKPPPSDVAGKLVDEVIMEEPLHARVCRWIFEDEAPEHVELARLLRSLEENFVLWVPVEGKPLSDCQLRISRREIHPPDRIFVPRPLYAERKLETAAGEATLEGNLAEGSRPTFRSRALIERLPKALALRPIEATAFDAEAGRATSSHFRVEAPPGFIVRNIRAGEMPLPEAGDPRVLEMDPKEDNVVIQGWDHRIAHVHLSKPRNPQLYCLVTLGPRSGLITPWMLATLLTAVILWVLHHHSKYGVAAPDPHSQLIFSSLGGDGNQGKERLGIGAENKQIAAAVLLVGPALASAWALRAEGGELLRSFLAGARLLLLLSAAVSIAAALALAGVLPTGVSSYSAMEIYAGLAYLVAAPMAIAWLLSSRPVWDVFRWVLNSPLPNVLLVGLAGSTVLSVGLIDLFPPRTAGFLLLLSGLGLALIGANSVAEPLRTDRRRARYRTVAGVSSLAVIFLAGAFLGFYAHLVPLEIARIGCVIVGLELLYCAERLRLDLLVSE